MDATRLCFVAVMVVEYSDAETPSPALTLSEGEEARQRMKRNRELP